MQDANAVQRVSATHSAAPSCLSRAGDAGTMQCMRIASVMPLKLSCIYASAISAQVCQVPMLEMSWHGPLWDRMEPWLLGVRAGGRPVEEALQWAVQRAPLHISMMSQTFTLPGATSGCEDTLVTTSHQLAPRRWTILQWVGTPRRPL
jgi:hypothetical protein